jgi:hypothetical protein
MPSGKESKARRYPELWIRYEVAIAVAFQYIQKKRGGEWKEVVPRSMYA